MGKIHFVGVPPVEWEQILRNKEECKRRGYPRISDEEKRDGRLAVVGGGPSYVSSYLDKTFDDDVWELYSDSDWSQANNLAQQMPEKLHELQRQFLIEATRYKVLPLDDRVGERMNSDTAGRPTLIRGNTQLLFGGMGRLSENCVLNLENKSHSVTAEVEVPAGGAEGVIVAQGANIGGWSLYAKGGKLKYCYNVAGVQHFFVEPDAVLPAGQHQVRVEFAYAGGGLGKGGKVTLFVDGKAAGQGSIPMTQAMIFSADDGCGHSYGLLTFPAKVTVPAWIST